MFDEAIAGLNINPNGIYIDATFGRGGHTRGILERLSSAGKVLGFDQDIHAIDYAKTHLQDSRLELFHREFSTMAEVLKARGLWQKIDGILLDLGVSSPQLDNAERGFSFNKDGALDMRMNQNAGISAAQWLAGADAVEIADILYQYGEEKQSRRIAAALKKYQQTAPIQTTAQLASIIQSVVKTHKNKHPATRSFQAIRIFINQELQQLSQALAQTAQLLASNGRLVVISFHSIEDRIVKRFIQQNSRAKPLLKGLPIMHHAIEPMPFKDLGKQFASKTELKRNRRARSAILRVAQKC